MKLKERGSQEEKKRGGGGVQNRERGGGDEDEQKNTGALHRENRGVGKCVCVCL